MLAVLEWMPVGLHRHSDLELIGAAVDHSGDEVDADIERDARHRIRLVAAEGRRSAMRDGEGEQRALAGDLAPFDVSSRARKQAPRAEQKMILPPPTEHRNALAQVK